MWQLIKIKKTDKETGKYDQDNEKNQSVEAVLEMADIRIRNQRKRKGIILHSLCSSVKYRHVHYK